MLDDNNFNLTIEPSTGTITGTVKDTATPGDQTFNIYATNETDQFSDAARCTVHITAKPTFSGLQDKTYTEGDTGR